MKRKSKKERRHTKNSRKYLLLVSLFALLTVAGLGVKQLLFPPVFPFVHGPHLSKALYASGLNQQEILGSKANKSNLKSKRAPTLTPTPTQEPIPTPTPTIQAINLPTPTPGVITRQNQYGISAGGGLPYLDQADLDTYFTQLKELGVSWVRWDFDWGLIQKNGSTDFDWSGADRVAQTANKYGITALGIITYTPNWAQLPECKGTFACAPADPAAFGIFAGQVASRYAPLGIHCWEIWNEPNYHGFWKPTPDVGSYVAILKSAYENIKKVDPSAFILSAGLASAGDENNNIAPITFIQTLYNLDTTKDFDAIALHPYSYPAVASYPASWNSWQQMGTVRQLMSDNGDSNKQLWLTEYGAPTGGPGSPHETTQLSFTYGQDYMSENGQLDIMKDALLMLSQMTEPVGPFFWYSLKDDGTDNSTPENFFGLLRFDLSKKPAYDAYRNAILGI